MAKLFNGMINFASAIKPTGAQPLDDRTVVQSFADLLADETFGLAKYNGMLVAVVDDAQVYMLVDDKNSSLEDSWVAVGSGNGSVSVDTFEEAKELATIDNLGQVIYVIAENAAYIVTGAQSIMKLAMSTAGNIDEIVNSLQTTVGDAEKGLVKDVADLRNDVDAIEVPVKDVTVDGVSVLNEDGVAAITMPDLTPYALTQDVTTALSGKVDTVAGSRLMTDEEGNKLSGISAGAQVNVIETVKVNGTALEVTDKAVNVVIETPKVKGVDSADKMLTLTENGEVKSELSIKYLSADDSDDGKPYIALYGKNGTTLIDTLDATDFIKDGLLSNVVLFDREDGEKVLRLTWNSESGKEVVDVPVTELIDYYYAGDGLAFDDKTRKFSIDLKEGERFLVVDAAGLGIDETTLWAAADEKYDVKGAAASAETAAKLYADGLAKNYDTAGAADDVKEYADETFVKVEGFNEFTEAMETKLSGISAGAQVNVIENVKVNGVEAVITDKVANVTIDADKVTVGANILDGENVVYSADTKVSSVLQGIQDSINAAVSGGLTGVVAGQGVEVSAVAGNKQTISAKLSVDEGNMLAMGTDGGLFAAMYYDGDDAE